MCQQQQGMQRGPRSDPSITAISGGMRCIRTSHPWRPSQAGRVSDLLCAAPAGRTAWCCCSTSRATQRTSSTSPTRLAEATRPVRSSGARFSSARCTVRPPAWHGSQWAVRLMACLAREGWKSTASESLRLCCYTAWQETYSTAARPVPLQPSGPECSICIDRWLACSRCECIPLPISRSASDAASGIYSYASQ